MRYRTHAPLLLRVQALAAWLLRLAVLVGPLRTARTPPVPSAALLPPVQLPLQLRQLVLTSRPFDLLPLADHAPAGSSWHRASASPFLFVSVGQNSVRRNFSRSRSADRSASSFVRCGLRGRARCSG